MPEIKGTIVNIRDFLSTDAVQIKISGASESLFELETGRTYVIPDYQREIRWTAENLIELMNDISVQPKFLGNIILTRNSKKQYSIIDGQQRTTLLRMIVQYIAASYGDELPDPPAICRLENDAFVKYEEFQSNNFSFDGLSEDEIHDIVVGDQYRQADRYQLLWNTIKQSGIVSDASKARNFVNNLYRCSFNIILSEEDSTNYSIEYFLDVNLKGVKLDTEDIFKGYLFHLDPSAEVRQTWVDLKQKAQAFNVACRNPRLTTECYPLMKIIEHFMYCYLYDNDRYADIVFGEDFCLKQQIQIDSTMHYVGEHILKVINNNKYIRTMLQELIKFLDLAIDIVESETPTKKFKDLFVVGAPDRKVDHDEITVFHKFIKMIMLDRKVIISKAFVMKYVINTLFNCENNTVEAYKQMYAVQMYVTLFSIFESKKGIEPVAKILKSTNWINEISTAIQQYCDKSTITERKRGAEFKFSTNPDNEEQRYHSIALAAVYNFFFVKGDKLGVRNGKTKELFAFLTDSEKFSTEHFIANNSGKYKVKFCDSDDDFEYEYPTEIKKYAASIFNYIYISRGLNDSLGNRIVNEKMQLIRKEDIVCEFSQCVYEAAQKAFINFPELKVGEYESNKDKMDRYFAYDFKRQYAYFVTIVLNDVARRFCGEDN